MIIVILDIQAAFASVDRYALRKYYDKRSTWEVRQP